MAKHVIILGAGASREAGAPMMGDFLDEARRIYAIGKSGDKKDSFDRVFSAISKLQNVHSKADLDIQNIESVFTTFEMAKTLKKFPGTEEGKDIDRLIDDLKWLIVVTLEQTVRFNYSSRSLKPHSCYEKLVKLIDEARTKNNGASISVLTFNYDIAFDVACALSGVGIDYGLQPTSANARSLPLLKLHGSINWSSSLEERSKIVPWYITDYFSKIDWHFINSGDISLPIGSQLNKMNAKVDGVPVIVPPSWNKADSHRSVATVWSRAAQELSEAENIYIIGYSLPPTDSFFKQLYALGTVGDKLLKRFWVFNPDMSRKDIFAAMLGPGAKQRFAFPDVNNRFSDSLLKIREGLLD